MHLYSELPSTRSSSRYRSASRAAFSGCTRPAWHWIVTGPACGAGDGVVVTTVAVAALLPLPLGAADAAAVELAAWTVATAAGCDATVRMLPDRMEGSDRAAWADDCGT